MEAWAGLDEVRDFPARQTRQRRRLPADQMIPVIEATFVLDEAEIKGIEDKLGPGTITGPEFIWPLREDVEPSEKRRSTPWR